ncbi:MAG: DUF350 domain-containing protein [Candidatus Saccharimonas sp.]
MTTFASLPMDITYQLGLFGLISLYSVLGVLLMLACVALCNYVFRVDLRKELLKDQNPAMGMMFAGLFIAIAIIIAASIAG